MKNIISYLLVALSIMNFEYAVAAGNEPEQKGRGGGGRANIKPEIVASIKASLTGKADGSCNDSSKLKFTLNKMQFLDADLQGMISPNCTVIRFGPDGTYVNDRMARMACERLGLSKNALNPGNPQYIGEIDGAYSRDENKLGYYFCVDFNKREMCAARKGVVEKQDNVKVFWQQKQGSQMSEYNSGDCMCQPLNSPNARPVTCPKTSEALQAANNCTDPLAKWNEEAKECRCNYASEQKPVVGGPACPSEPVAAANPTVDDNDFANCFSGISAAQKACSESGQKAFDQCSKDAPGVNANIAKAQNVLTYGLQGLVASNAGTGAVEACQKMSAAGTTLISALSFLKKSCKDELDNCKKGCEEVKAYSGRKIEDMAKECKDSFGDKPWTRQHEARFKELATQYQEGAKTADNFCKGDIQLANNELADFLDKLLVSVSGADVCKCQLTVGSDGTCEQVASVLTCAQNVNQPACTFSSVGCAPGSTAANCATAGVVNPGGSGLKGVSGFAGPGISSLGGGVTPSGKMQIGDGDFNLYDETRPIGSGTATAAEVGSPFGSASNPGGSGGFGGGGGGPSGGSGGGSKEGDGSEKSGLAGFFQSAKSGLASMFGSTGSNSASTKKGDNKNYKNDVNAFRPKGSSVRGMANAGNEFGGKNRDIWKTVNERYNDQYHTFITVEAPSK